MGVGSPVHLERQLQLLNAIVPQLLPLARHDASENMNDCAFILYVHANLLACANLVRRNPDEYP
eukprot:CAMPEP_0181071730 /NCGR_PEP_ID=MMETSP1070-20121207/28195_1 /TAXON_ID=265543 /ORGANISM="Minutocellus polymorphus, Strain NH13" /LENGTH=63 /DNA_ID=CAMNT_0023152741 /DNA_START=580 /DNA_END=767 /DNA_ORIENTATION=+